MPLANINDIQICYERIGDPAAPAIILIMGKGCQLLMWPDTLCGLLVENGFQVVRFDNRDCGLSSKFDQHGKTKPLTAYVRHRLGLPVSLPYTLHDMASDVLGLMDTLELEQAHIVGASMGGMIAQLLAADHANRVQTLGLLMTTSGRPGLPGPSLKVLRWMLRKRPSDPDLAVDDKLKTFRLIGSPAYWNGEDALRRTLRRQVDRNVCPEGSNRQLAAIIANGSRVQQLRRIKQPSLILHGAADPLMPVAHAHDLAEHLPHAQIKLFEGMGHDLPDALIPDITNALLKHFCEGGGRQSHTQPPKRLAPAWHPETI